MSRLVKALSVLFLATLSTAGWAQSATPSPAAVDESKKPLTLRERARVMAAQPASQDATATSPLGLGSVVNLVASREKKEIAAQVGWQRGDNSLAFKFAGPIGDDDPQASLLDLAGLSDGASAEIKLTKVRWTYTPLPDTHWAELCFSYGRSLSLLQMPSDGKLQVGDIESVRNAVDFLDPWLGQKLKSLAAQVAGPMTNADALAAKTDLIDIVNDALADEDLLRELLRQSDASILTQAPALGALSKSDRTKWGRRLLDQIVHDRGSTAIRFAGKPCIASNFDEAGREAVVRATNPGKVWWYGLSAKAARSDFKYLNDASLAKEERTRYGSAFTASIGLLTKKNLFFSVSVSAQEKHKAAKDPIELCQPFNGGPSFSCAEVVLGEPNKQRRTVSTIEMRMVRGSFAISPSVAYVSDEKKAVLTIPLYFLKDADDGLRGGVTLKAVKGDWAVALFVGNVFKLGE